MQDLGKEDIDVMLPKILDLQRTIANTDIGATKGYGELDLSGNGKATSWHEWLLSHLSKPDFDWDSILNASLIDQSFLNDVFQAFRKLVNKVPNERQLYHGDFGSNNLLTHNRTIVAVIDWDATGYGDWLFDVASAYYWKNHLLCMSLLANYYEQELHDLPNYYDRINCYQLRAALIEMYVQAKRGDADKLNYHIHRCQDLLAELS